MSLRNQPYFPMYVQDFLTDEKLSECSPSATGVCIKVMCLMHKSEIYGQIELRSKDKVSNRPIHDLARRLTRPLPWSVEEIEKGLNELIEEGVFKFENDSLIQKRMVEDNQKSKTKAIAGKKGAKKKWDNENAKSIDVPPPINENEPF